MTEIKDWLGVYMTDDGPIDIRRDMPPDQMWFVLNKLMQDHVKRLCGMIDADRGMHLETQKKHDRLHSAMVEALSRNTRADAFQVLRNALRDAVNGTA